MGPPTPSPLPRPHVVSVWRGCYSVGMSGWDFRIEVRGRVRRLGVALAGLVSLAAAIVQLGAALGWWPLPEQVAEFQRALDPKD